MVVLLDQPLYNTGPGPGPSHFGYWISRRAMMKHGIAETLRCRVLIYDSLRLSHRNGSPGVSAVNSKYSINSLILLAVLASTTLALCVALLGWGGQARAAGHGHAPHAGGVPRPDHVLV